MQTQAFFAQIAYHFPRSDVNKAEQLFLMENFLLSENYAKLYCWLCFSQQKSEGYQYLLLCGSMGHLPSRLNWRNSDETTR